MNKFIVIASALLCLPALSHAQTSELITPEEFYQQHEASYDAFHDSQKMESETFSTTLGGIPQKAHAKAIHEFNQEQYLDRKAQAEKLHADYINHLQKAAGSSEYLNEDHVEDLITFFDKQHHENMEFLQEQYEQYEDFYDDLAEEDEMTEAERKIRMLDFQRDQQAQEAKHFQHQAKQNHDKIREYRADIHEEISEHLD